MAASDRLHKINAVVENIPEVTIVKPFELFDGTAKGSLTIYVKGLEEAIQFNVEIYPQYPFKWHDSESIKFFNKNLLDYKHVMESGFICIHSAHSPILSQKLVYDVQAVKAWIKKYYIDKDSDVHYEHLIVPQKNFKDSRFAFFFNEVDYQFSKNQFGYLAYSKMGTGLYYKDKCANSIIQRFQDKDQNPVIDLNWNLQLKSLNKYPGIYIFIKDVPSKNQRWVFEKWGDLHELLPQDFLNFLHLVEDRYKKSTGSYLPLLIGYNISESEVHWQAIMLEIGNFPVHGGKDNQNWVTQLNKEQAIDWAMTRNCSYKYFFGRGKLTDNITQARILIIGIGAIGSILAKTLVRSGCTKLGFIDFDVKEPENVCRSEYSFVTGMNNKTDDLANELYQISPFFVPGGEGYEFSEKFNFFLKSNLANKQCKSDLEEYLNYYDFVFDCSADDDLLYILSQLKMKSALLNISISNHAKHLVCATERNRYEFVTTQFNGTALEIDADDLHNPTGCWSPTFKASYNDINILVQFAVKHINLILGREKQLRNFVIETNDIDGLELKLKEF